MTAFRHELRSTSTRSNTNLKKILTAVRPFIGLQININNFSLIAYASLLLILGLRQYTPYADFFNGSQIYSWNMYKYHLVDAFDEDSRSPTSKLIRVGETEVTDITEFIHNHMWHQRAFLSTTHPQLYEPAVKAFFCRYQHQLWIDKLENYYYRNELIINKTRDYVVQIALESCDSHAN
ncbi:hypothetical protein [Elongatibacter sediminis]|uniref:Uncharacterized protein n=1 Tax=Elongatibacter sediminis TaxID=3119006 RepID=A0AAW9RFN5_9GAMM